MLAFRGRSTAGAEFGALRNIKTLSTTDRFLNVAIVTVPQPGTPRSDSECCYVAANYCTAAHDRSGPGQRASCT